jgi:transposase-like protein
MRFLAWCLMTDNCKHYYVPTREGKTGNEYRQVMKCKECGKQLEYKYERENDKLFTHLMYDGGM